MNVPTKLGAVLAFVSLGALASFANGPDAPTPAAPATREVRREIVPEPCELLALETLFARLHDVQAGLKAATSDIRRHHGLSDEAKIDFDEARRLLTVVEIVPVTSETHATNGKNGKGGP